MSLFENRIISPKLDIGFKAVFGDERHKDLLASLLAGVLELPVQSFTELTILNTELMAQFPEGKIPRLDLRVRLKEGTEIDIEIQLQPMKAYSERILLYWSRLYSSSFMKGSKYHDLNKCIVINFLDFELFDYPKMHSIFKIREEEYSTLLTDRLEIHFVELCKLNDYNRHIGNELLIAWADFLNIEDEEEVIHMLEKNLPEEIKKALEVLEEISKDPKMQEAALNLEMGISDYMTRIGEAEDRGMEKGREEGRVKGREEGLEEGLEIGEHKKSLEFAKALKNEGFENQLIAKLTGIGIEEIDGL